MVRSRASGKDELQETLRATVKALVELCEWKPTQLANAAGVAPSTVNRFLNGSVDVVLSSRTVARLKDAALRRLTDLDVEDPGGSDSRTEKWRRLNEAERASTPAASPRRALAIVGAVQAGAFRDALEWPRDEWKTAPVGRDQRYPDVEQFCLEVRGPSMDLLYPEGTVLVCVNVIDLGRDPRSGERVIVLRRLDHDDGFEATVKELRQEPDGTYWLWPRSTSPAFQQPQRLAPKNDGERENDDTRIVALVVGSYRLE